MEDHWRTSVDVGGGVPSAEPSTLGHVGSRRPSAWVSPAHSFQVSDHQSTACRPSNRTIAAMAVHRQVSVSRASCVRLRDAPSQGACLHRGSVVKSQKSRRWMLLLAALSASPFLVCPALAQPIAQTQSTSGQARARGCPEPVDRREGVRTQQSLWRPRCHRDHAGASGHVEHRGVLARTGRPAGRRPQWPRPDGVLTLGVMAPAR